MANNPDDELLTPDDLAHMLQVPKATIYAWRSHGEGPKGFRIGRHLRWRRSDANAWIEERAKAS
jgi:excisionase family DNA binding protein